MPIAHMSVEEEMRVAERPLMCSSFDALLDLRGRTAWILGGSRGLGFACAQALLCRGAKVILISRQSDSLHVAMAKLNCGHPSNRVDCFACDLRGAVDRADLLKKLESPDILVANTGGPSFGRAEVQTAADWMTAFNDLFISLTEVIAGVIPAMKSRGWGRIVLLSSATLRNPNPELALSQVVRSALAGYIAASSRDLVRYGVTLNALLAGSFATERTKTYLRDAAEKEQIPFNEIQSRLKASIPAGRLGRPEELGLWCALLASEAGAFISGQQIVIDGGSTTVLCA